MRVLRLTETFAYDTLRFVVVIFEISRFSATTNTDLVANDNSDSWKIVLELVPVNHGFR